MSTVISLPLAWNRHGRYLASPVLGYALFMLLQTPLANVIGQYLPEHFGSVLLIITTIILLMRKSRRPRIRGTDIVEICALSLSLVVLLRQTELEEYIALGSMVRVVSTAFLWGPQLMAINRLDDKEMDILRFWMSVAGIVVGVWGMLIYLTGSGYLMRSATWGDTDTVADLISYNAESIVKGRFIVMGIFTVVPSAYWFVLRGVLVQNRQHWLWRAALYAGIGAILISVGISVTRGLLLLLGIGTVVMLGSWVLATGKYRRYRNRMLTILAIGGCLIWVVLSRIDLTVVIEQYQQRFSTLGSDDSNVVARLDDTANAWAYIKQDLCLFGAPGPKPLANYRRMGDPALPMFLWLYYGLPGLVLASILFLIAFWRLFKCWLAHRLDPEQQLLRSMLTAWALCYVYVMIAGSYMHPPEVFFMVLFFSEINRFYSKCMAGNNSQPRRAAA